MISGSIWQWLFVGILVCGIACLAWAQWRTATIKICRSARKIADAFVPAAFAALGFVVGIGDQVEKWVLGLMHSYWAWALVPLGAYLTIRAIGGFEIPPVFDLDGKAVPRPHHKNYAAGFRITLGDTALKGSPEIAELWKVRQGDQRALQLNDGVPIPLPRYMPSASRWSEPEGHGVFYFNLLHIWYQSDRHGAFKKHEMHLDVPADMHDDLKRVTKQMENGTYLIRVVFHQPEAQLLIRIQWAGEAEKFQMARMSEKDFDRLT